jgi:hypothetical protein
VTPSGHPHRSTRPRARWPTSASLLVVGVCLTGCSTVRPDGALRVATGFVSHTLCSETFVSGLAPGQVYAETLQPYPGFRWVAWAFRYTIDSNRREVRTTLAGAFESRAVYREGLGCFVVHGADPVDDALPESTVVEGEVSGPAAPAFAEPGVVEATDAGLRAALDRAFAEPQQPPYRWIKAVVVVVPGTHNPSSKWFLLGT